jgi:hypothetical protein
MSYDTDGLEEVETIWRQLLDPATPGTNVRAAIVRMLRERAGVWERADETELYGECHSIADLIEGQCVGAEKLGVPQRGRPAT